MTVSGPRTKSALDWRRELLIAAAIYIVYALSRGVPDDDPNRAARVGRAILHWEHAWYLDPEKWLNHLLQRSVPVEVVFSYFYSTLHYVVTPIVLAWVFARHAARYRLMRTTLALSTVIGMVGYYFAPTAPPRLLAGSGISDTLAATARFGWWSDHGSVPRGMQGISNQFAAMPSLHVGWAIWCGYVLFKYGKHTVTRWAGAAYPVLTTVIVVATGNHYLLDAIAGGATIALAGALSWLIYRRAVVAEAEAIVETAPPVDLVKESPQTYAVPSSGQCYRGSIRV